MRLPRTTVLLASAGIMVAAWGPALPASAALNTSANRVTGSNSRVRAVEGGTATYAESADNPPDYIFPIDPGADQTVANSSDFQQLMWRPLIWEGAGKSTGIDWQKSIASSVKYSANSSTVTVTLKQFKWSDGLPVTSRDVEFDYNLLRANKTSWGFYTPGELPDNVTKFTILTPRSFRLTLNGSYSQLWFTNNQLSLLYPLPQQAWDKTSATGKVGNYDLTTSGAKAVFAFLSHQGGIVSTLATNPLWKVVDGPWTLSAYDIDGEATFVPNTKYSGTDKPRLSQFIELPYTSDAAEFNVLRAGNTIDVGYLPPEDVKEAPVFKGLGYTMEKWIVSGIWYIIPNLTNPQVGKILSQLYIREAIEELVPQDSIIKNIFDGNGFPEYGPVPLEPASNLVSPQEKKPFYPFSIASAIKLLKNHGWSVHPNGTDVCVKAGTGQGQCGAGIPKGKKLSLDLLYATGNQAMTLETEDLQSEAAKAGITLSLKSGPVNTVFGDMAPCPTACSWQLGFYGSLTYPSGLPLGTNLWTTGGSLNAGSWDDPESNRLITAAVHDSGLQTFYNYENYIAKELPWIWVANMYGSLEEVKSTLGGVSLNVYHTLTPEDWYYTK